MDFADLVFSTVTITARGCQIYNHYASLDRSVSPETPVAAVIAFSPTIPVGIMANRGWSCNLRRHLIAPMSLFVIDKLIRQYLIYLENNRPHPSGP